MCEIRRRLLGIAGVSLTLVLLSVPFQVFAQAWSWQVGNGANSARNCQAEGVLAPLTADEVLWEGSTVYTYWPHQPFTQDDVMVTDRTFNMADVLHGTAIVAYNLLSGDTLWTQDLPVTYPGTDWRNRVCGCWEGVVYATRSGNTNASHLYALDIADGSVIWESVSLVDMSSTECVVFAPNGDLIVGNFHSITRIDATDGTTIWEETRYSPTSGGSEVALFDDHVYGWAASGDGPKIVVHDLATGTFLYESHGIGGGIVQQLGCLVGPDGIVYAPRTCNNVVTDSLVAFEDTGSSLDELWHIHLAYVPFATFGVDLAGNIYSYTPDYRIIHIDSHSGETLNLSGPVAVDHPVNRHQFFGGTIQAAAGENRIRVSIPDLSSREPAVLDTSIVIADPDEGVVSPQAAVDAEGYLYVTNHQAELYCFDSTLNLIWLETFDRPDGPAIAGDGHLVICADSYEMQVYTGRGAVDEPSGGTLFVGLEGGTLPTFHSDMSGFPDVTWTSGFSFDVSGAAATEEGIIYLCEGAFTTHLYEATLETAPQQLCTIEEDMSGLAYGRDQLWGYSNYADPRGIYSIDPASGATELALDVGALRFFALGYNPVDDLFYGYSEYGTSGLYSVDIDSGEMIHLAGTIPATNGQGRGLAVGNNTVFLTATRGDDDIPCFAYDIAQGAGGEWAGFPNPYPDYHSTGGAAWIPDEIDGVPDMGGRSLHLPQNIILSQNYPNPFNPTTTIEFTLPYQQNVQLTVYNVLGELVAVLADGMQQAGVHRVTFNPSVGAESSRPLASGVYVYRLESEDDIVSRKMVLIR